MWPCFCHTGDKFGDLSFFLFFRFPWLRMHALTDAEQCAQNHLDTTCTALMVDAVFRTWQEPEAGTCARWRRAEPAPSSRSHRWGQNHRARGRAAVCCWADLPPGSSEKTRRSTSTLENRTYSCRCGWWEVPEEPRAHTRTLHPRFGQWRRLRGPLALDSPSESLFWTSTWAHCLQLPRNIHL